jgi:hypothetical protein
MAGNQQLSTMLGWTTLTTDDVLAQFNDSETSAYDTAKNDPKSADLPDIIGKVVAQVWDAWNNGGRNVDVQGSGTIPNSEKNRAISVVRWLYLLALPTGQSLCTKERQKLHDDALAYWEKIAKREIKVAGSVQLGRRGRHVRTKSFDGLSTA